MSNNRDGDEFSSTLAGFLHEKSESSRIPNRRRDKPGEAQRRRSGRDSSSSLRVSYPFLTPFLHRQRPGTSPASCPFPLSPGLTSSSLRRSFLALALLLLDWNLRLSEAGRAAAVAAVADGEHSKVMLESRKTAEASRNAETQGDSRLRRDRCACRRAFAASLAAILEEGSVTQGQFQQALTLF